MQAEATIIEDMPKPLVPVGSFALIERAVERGLDADQLGKLMDLYERMEREKSKALYAAAMNACQQALPAVVKDSKNAHTSSLYAKVEAVQEAIKPVIMANGFSVSWTEGPIPEPGVRCVIMRVRHTGGHMEEFMGHYHVDGQGAKGGGNMSAIQGAVSSHTYAQRDLLRLAFNITIAGLDRDGNNLNATIDEAKVAYLMQLIQASGADLAKLLSFAEPELEEAERGLDRMRETMYPAVLDFLKRKLKGGAK